MKDKPDHHDADLVLKVYEMRREPKMRESRDAITQKFWPRSYDDVAAVMKFDHPLNAAWRQVSTFWEMVYGMTKHGIVHADYFLESNGEGFLLFAKIAPFLAELREKNSPRMFQNAEWAATNTNTGKVVFAMFQGRVEAMAKTFEAFEEAAKK